MSIYDCMKDDLTKLSDLIQDNELTIHWNKYHLYVSDSSGNLIYYYDKVPEALSFGELEKTIRELLHEV